LNNGDLFAFLSKTREVGWTTIMEIIFMDFLAHLGKS